MGFLDSSSSIITCILTRAGRNALAKNDGSFRISRFSFGDDEINYQLYNAATDNDTDILNLPILEPSSNELTALRYRLVTAPRGTTQVGYLIANPTSLSLQNTKVANPRIPSVGTILVSTIGVTDTAYLATSRNSSIATVISTVITASQDTGGQSSGIISVKGGLQDGTTYIDITGRDSGAILSIPCVVTSNVSVAQ